MKQKLVFFFPWHQVSGGPFYLGRLANDVARLGIYDVYYTDYAHGLCDTILEEKSIKILKYNDKADFEIFPEEPVILVMAEYWAHVVPVVHPETKIVFFNWHNECIPVLQRDWYTTDAYMEKFLTLIRETSSVFFCDKTHWLSHTRNHIEARELYVPIIIPERKQIAKRGLIKTGVRNIAVLGRLVVDKIYAVLDLLDNIINLRDRVKTNVYVIGEGDYEHLLFDRKFPDYINIIRCGTMDIKAVISLLSRKVDILFAMGTSVLDGASIHLPSVVLPNDMKPFECNRYPYLYECKGYALGWYPNQIDELDLHTNTVEEIFHDVYDLKKKDEIGEKCFEHYYRFHRTNIDAFLTAIDASTLTAEIFHNFCRKNINWKRLGWFAREKFRRIRGTYSKRFCIFGFPIFTAARINDYFTNIYVCCIPLFRIKHVNHSYSVSILLLVWMYRAICEMWRLFSGGRNEEKDDE